MIIITQPNATEEQIERVVARVQRMSPEQRLHFHQEHSGPVMDKLHIWLSAQFDERKVEPNSGLGTAISYLLKH